MESIDRTAEHSDQRLVQGDQWLERAKQRQEQTDRKFAMIMSQIENLLESVRGLQRWSWMPYLVMGLAFAGLYFALFAIWLGMVRNAA